MDIAGWLAGGAVVGVLAACWNYVRSIAWKAAGLLIQRVEFIDTRYSEVLLGHALKHYKLSPTYDRVYDAAYTIIRNDRYGCVPYELYGRNSLIFWSGWWAVFYTQSNAPPQGGAPTEEQKSKSSEITSIAFTFLRGTISFDKVVADAISEYNEGNWKRSQLAEKTDNRFEVIHVPDIANEAATANNKIASLTQSSPWYRRHTHRLFLYAPEDIERSTDRTDSMLSQLIFPEHVLQVIEDIRRWRNSSDWYIKRHIPWRRGLLLFGPAGTGKTILTRSLAEDMGLPIYVYRLGELGNKSFMRAWKSMRAASPCIALFEDFDNVFHGRKNIAPTAPWHTLYNRKQLTRNSDEPNSDTDSDLQESGTLTFDVLLNTLDGVDQAEGIFTVITTNDLTKIDPAIGVPQQRSDGTSDALSTRPGRIDRAVELTYMTEDNKLKFAERIVGDYPEALETVKKHIAKGYQETPAQLQSLCCQLALQYFWAEQ